jgi:hypothetical protein
MKLRHLLWQYKMYFKFIYRIEHKIFPNVILSFFMTIHYTIIDLKILAKQKYCKHEYKNYSYANENEGIIILICKKCDKEYRKILY